MYKNRYTNKYRIKKHLPYTYCITHKRTGIKYYGSRYFKYAHPSLFFVDYFTSSSIVHVILKEEGIEAFSVEIRKVFKSREDCISWENKVLRRLNVRFNPNFFNMDQDQGICDNRNLMSISNVETEKCIRIKKGDFIPLGWVLGIIKKRKTNHSLRKWFHNPITGHSAFDLLENIPEGLVPGRGPNNKSNSKTLKDKNNHWITNGLESKLVGRELDIPEGWIKGRPFTGERLYTNGIINIKTKNPSDVPEGFYLVRN